MTFVTLALFALVTFLALPLAVYCGAAALMRPRPGEHVPLLLLTGPMAPLVLALVLMWLYSLPLRPPPALIILVVLVAIAAMLLVGRSHLIDLRRELGGRRARRKPDRSAAHVLLWLVLALVVLQIVSLPMMENDALEYMAVARHIFEARSLSVYPVAEAAPNGLFAPSSHPPAYHMYLAWGYAWLGPTNFAPARLLSLYALAGMAALFWVVLRRHGERTVAMAVLLLLTVPLYVSMLVGYHIDPLRLLAFLAAAIATAQVIECPQPRQAVLTGALLGLAGFAHSIGILAWLFGGIAWLVLGPADRFRNLRIPLVVGTVALAVGGLQFAKNMVVYGVPLQDSAPVWEMPELRFHEDLRYRRDLIGRFDRVVFGVLRGLFELPLFSLLFWLMLPVLWRIWHERARAGTFELVAALWIILYFGLAAATAAIGADLVIKNARYLMTLAPLAVLLIAPMLARWQPEGRWGRRVLAVLLVGLSSWVLLQSVVRTANFGGRADIALAGERAPIYRANDRFPGAPLYRHLEQHLQPGERTLLFRQADFTTYGKGDWLDNFDTALMPLYRMATVEAAHTWLRARNVRFVMVPDYTFPTNYRTIVGKLLADDRYVEAIGGHRGFRLLRLNDAPLPSRCSDVDQAMLRFGLWQYSASWLDLVASVSGLPFLSSSNVEFLGPAPLAGTGLGNWRPLEPQIWPTSMTTAYGKRLMLATGNGPIDLPPAEPWAQLGDKRGPIRIAFEAKGNGLIAIDVVQFVKRPSIYVPRVTRLWDGVVYEDARTAEVQFVPEADASSFRLVVTNSGRAAAHFELSRVTMCRRLDPAVAKGAAEVVQHQPVVAPSKEVARWPAAQFHMECLPDDKGLCRPVHRQTYVREVTGDVIRFLGPIERVATPGFLTGLGATYGRILESWRLYLEREPDSRIGQYLTPLQRWLSGAPPAESFSPHRVTLTAGGEGTYSIYLQMVTSSGAVYYLYAGSVFLSGFMSSYGLDVMIPKGSKQFEVALIGGSVAERPTSLVLGGITLETLAQP